VRERFFTPRFEGENYDELNAWLLDGTMGENQRTRSGPPGCAHPMGRKRRQRLPASDDTGALPRLQVVGDGGEQPAQLDGGRQLASLLECGADRSGFRFGDDEHPASMGTRTAAGKRPLAQARVRG
jgi:hypothetical protein